MPQVAARINNENERWLKDYFKTKSAGAEFILPWAVDTFFRGIRSLKSAFSAAELKTIVQAHKDTRLTPENTRLSYLILRVTDACEYSHAHENFGTSKSNLEAKLKRLDDTQAAALMVWASAYWVSKSITADSLEEYIQNY